MCFIQEACSKSTKASRHPLSLTTNKQVPVMIQSSQAVFSSSEAPCLASTRWHLYGVVHKWGYPQMDGLKWEIPISKGWWLGVPPFQETSIWVLDLTWKGPQDISGCRWSLSKGRWSPSVLTDPTRRGKSMTAILLSWKSTCPSYDLQIYGNISYKSP